MELSTSLIGKDGKPISASKESAFITLNEKIGNTERVFAITPIQLLEYLKSLDSRQLG
jgi:hypothetical protein